MLSKKAVAVGAALFIVGNIIGCTAAPKTTVVDAAPVPAPATKTVEKAVNKTPQSCKDALGYADQGFLISGQAFGYVSDFISGVTNSDLDAMQTANENISQSAKRITPILDKYREARDSCQSS